jgi:hypothetical protein
MPEREIEPDSDGRSGYGHVIIQMCQEEFNADCRGYEQEVLRICPISEYFPTVSEYGAVEAWDWFGLFYLLFDFLGFFVVSGGDYKDLCAVEAAGAFSGVFVGKGNQGVAVWAVELNCHILVLRINSKFKYQMFKTRFFASPPFAQNDKRALLNLLHSINKAGDIVCPFFGFEEVDLVGFYEHCEMLFHGYHFFVGFVPGFCLQLGINLFYFSGSYQVGAGVVIV